MKYAFLLIVLVFISCNAQYNYENFISNSFPIKHSKAGFEKVPYGSVYAIQYKSEGIIKNNTKEIYKSFFITMRITFILTNGNEISNEELDPYPFLIPSYLHLIRGQFSPKESVEFDLGSPRITGDYKDYPIKKVIVMYSVTAEDPINNQKLNGIIYQKDVTSEWNNFIDTFNEKVD